MTAEQRSHLPDPSREAVNAWVRRITEDYLHKEGWDEVNERAHALVMGGRQLANRMFPDNPEKQAGFYAGIAYGLLGPIHFHDIELIAELMASETSIQEVPDQAVLFEIPGRGNATGGDGGGEAQPHAA